MFQGMVVLVGNWQMGSCPKGLIVLGVVAPMVVVPKDSCPRGSCNETLGG